MRVPVLRLLAILDGLGISPALVAGLLLMPAVVAIGYLSDRGADFDPATTLRGSFDAAASRSTAHPHASAPR